MKYINLTSHEIVFFSGEEKQVIPPCGIELRVDVTRSWVTKTLAGHKVYANRRGEIYGKKGEEKLSLHNVLCSLFGSLDEAWETDDVCLVSFQLLQALEADKTRFKRGLFMAPDTTPESVVRDAQGKIIGVRDLQVL